MKENTILHSRLGAFEIPLRDPNDPVFSEKGPCRVIPQRFKNRAERRKRCTVCGWSLGNHLPFNRAGVMRSLAYIERLRAQRAEATKASCN